MTSTRMEELPSNGSLFVTQTCEGFGRFCWKLYKIVTDDNFDGQLPRRAESWALVQPKSFKHFHQRHWVRYMVCVGIIVHMIVMTMKKIFRIIIMIIIWNICGGVPEWSCPPEFPSGELQQLDNPLFLSSSPLPLSSSSSSSSLSAVITYQDFLLFACWAIKFAVNHSRL